MTDFFDLKQNFNALLFQQQSYFCHICALFAIKCEFWKICDLTIVDYTVLMLWVWRCLCTLFWRSKSFFFALLTSAVPIFNQNIKR